MQATVKKIKNEKYTGENRCLPCTIVNVGIAGVAGGALWTVSRGVGLLAFVGAVGVIYFQGYLVPGTPELTKKYLPAVVLRAFGKSPPGHGDLTTLSEVSEEDTAIDVEDTLIESGVAQLVDGGEDITLTEPFRSRWREEIQSTSRDVEAERFVEVFGFDVSDYRVERYDEGVAVFTGDQQIAQWPSQAALVADFAATRIAPDWVEGWDELNQVQRGKLLHGLRVFLTECPTGGPVKLDVNTVESCCSKREVVVARCTESGERLFEQAIE